LTDGSILPLPKMFHTLTCPVLAFPVLTLSRKSRRILLLLETRKKRI
jgi:hypothetical protein